LDRNELGALLVQAGLGSPRDHALISLLAMNWLRISEALGADIDDVDVDRGHRTLRVVRKRRLRRRPDGQAAGPPGRDHQADLTAHLRYSFITAALDAGVPLRDAQEAASHADPRTTMRYDRARASLDRHAT